MALTQYHVPFDSNRHVFMLGGEPESLAVEHAKDEDPGLTFWAESGDSSRVFRVFSRDEFLPVGGCALIGEARLGHGLR